MKQDILHNKLSNKKHRIDCININGVEVTDNTEIDKAFKEHFAILWVLSFVVILVQLKPTFLVVTGGPGYGSSP